jgi:4-amino-4-deoxy-L-arabinose transferase-like glycosyltransferase
MPSGRVARELLGRLGRVREPWWVASATLVSFIVTVWWITQDNQVPDFDEGMHLIDAIVVRTEISQGQLSAPFTDFNNYPPLVHIVGAIGLLIAGLHESAAIIADNVFFLPMLAGGCYVAGAVAFGRRAGLLAAIFALCTPMWVSEMREFYVDPGETAMVAASVGAILASRRFERVWISALAGFTCSLGMLSKQTFVLFLAGLIVVVIVRGGWRNWRGLTAFVLAGAALTLPWYIYHYGQLSVLTLGATSPGVAAGNASAALGITPSRWSGANFAWYFWDLINHQALLQLTLFFLVGTTLALWRFARRRDPDDLTPELAVGGLVGYLGVTYINLKDPRYSLPDLVYIAVLGTGWVARARLPWRRWLTTALALIAATNFAMVSFGWGPVVSWTLPGPYGPSVSGARVITFFSPAGWLRGGPVRDGDVLALMEGLKRLGFRYIELDGQTTDTPDFDQNGLGVLTIESHLPEPPAGLVSLGPHDAFLLRHYPMPGDPPPCQHLLDGSGVYVEVGLANPAAEPFSAYRFVCPGRRHPYYR